MSKRLELALSVQEDTKTHKVYSTLPRLTHFGYNRPNLTGLG